MELTRREALQVMAASTAALFLPNIARAAELPYNLQKILKEKEKIYHKWKKAGWPDRFPAGLPDHCFTTELAVWLENQIALPDDNIFKKYKYLLPARIHPNLIASHIGNHWNFVAPKTMCFFYHKSKFIEHEFQCCHRKLKTVFSVEAIQDLRLFHGIDAEEELLNVFAHENAVEMNSEMINILKNNAHFQCKSIFDADKHIKKAIGHTPNFIIKGGEGHATILVQNNIETIHDIFCLPENETIVGYRNLENRFNTGFCWGAFDLELMPMFMSPDTFTPQRTLLFRYGYKLIPEYFAVVKH